MRGPNFAVATATILAFSVVVTAPAFARGGGGGMGHAPAWQGSSPPGFSRGEKKGWNGASIPRAGARAGKWDGMAEVYRLAFTDARPRASQAEDFPPGTEPGGID